MTITREGSVSAAATTATLPTHTAGDLLLAYAYTAGAATPSPGVPDGWTSLADNGSGLNADRVAYKIAASSGETSGIWAGADMLIIHVYRCTGRWKPPLVATAGNTWVSDTIEYPDLAARAGDGWFVRFAGDRTATDMQDITPDGWVAVDGDDTLARSLDTDGPVSVSASEVGDNTQLVNAEVSWRAATVSVAEATEPDPDTGARTVWDTIPEAAAVLTLSGLCFNAYNDMPAKLQGLFAQAPYTMTQVKYPASLAESSITQGVTLLDSALAASAGAVIVLAHDQGAQVCSRWMRTYADDTARTDLADRVVFVLTGNPLRSNNGGTLIGGKEVDGLIGEVTPTDTPWPIVDIARRYDGYADQPADTTNTAAVNNAAAGKTVLHKAYGDVDLYDPSHIITTDANTTYILTVEDALPLLDGKPLSLDPDKADEVANVTAALRKWIETGYDNRPDDDPDITVAQITNWWWRAVLTKIGVDLTVVEDTE